MQRIAQAAALRIALKRWMDARFDAVEARIVQRVEACLNAFQNDVIFWMFASWSSLVLLLLGTLVAVLRGH